MLLFANMFPIMFRDLSLWWPHTHASHCGSQPLRLFPNMFVKVFVNSFANMSASMFANSYAYAIHCIDIFIHASPHPGSDRPILEIKYKRHNIYIHIYIYINPYVYIYYMYIYIIYINTHRRHINICRTCYCSRTCSRSCSGISASDDTYTRFTLRISAS